MRWIGLGIWGNGMSGRIGGMSGVNDVKIDIMEEIEYLEYFFLEEAYWHDNDSMNLKFTSGFESSSINNCYEVIAGTSDFSTMGFLVNKFGVRVENPNDAKYQYVCIFLDVKPQRTNIIQENQIFKVDLKQFAIQKNSHKLATLVEVILNLKHSSSSDPVDPKRRTRTIIGGG